MKAIKTKNSLQLLRYTLILLSLALSSILIQGCSSEEKKAESGSEAESGNLMKDAEEMEDDGLGFGPVKSMTIPSEIDEQLAAEGLKHFEAKCTACHKFSNDKYVGPGLA